NGSFVYTPMPDFVGTVTFDYTIQTTVTREGLTDYDDVTGVYTSTATVTINVLPPKTADVTVEHIVDGVKLNSTDIIEDQKVGTEVDFTSYAKEYPNHAITY